MGIVSTITEADTSIKSCRASAASAGSAVSGIRISNTTCIQ